MKGTFEIQQKAHHQMKKMNRKRPSDMLGFWQEELNRWNQFGLPSWLDTSELPTAASCAHIHIILKNRL